MLEVSRSRSQACIIGAGPAGLAAAYELSKADRSVVVVEKDPTTVGGLSRTLQYKGCRFDIGGHRFYSRNRLIEDLWTEILGDRMLTRKRLSRIYYRGRLFRYPLEIMDVLHNLGPREAGACITSYLLRPRKAAESVATFEDWVCNAFGRRLYEIFFKTYTEKVWGIPCDEISADWAAQRIRGLSMGDVAKQLLPRGLRPAPVIKTLIESFRYPAGGPGELWEALAGMLRRRSVRIQMGESVRKITRGVSGVTSVVTESAAGAQAYDADNFVSTMAIRDLILALDPPAPTEVLAAARALRYRDFLVVVLILDRADLFPDQWIYVHEPKVQVGRIQNFKNWSPEMVPDQRVTALGLEYFCSADASLWNSDDNQLIAFAQQELSSLSLSGGARLLDAAVVRQPAAYPIYDGGYREKVRVVRDFARRHLPNLQLVGRNGMHKYNNQDHAMLTGMMAAWNILGGSYDPWRVNADALYLEGGEEGESGVRLVPSRVADVQVSVGQPSAAEPLGR
jgi:protoporphyrinogen oxidase